MSDIPSNIISIEAARRAQIKKDEPLSFPDMTPSRLREEKESEDRQRFRLSLQEASGEGKDAYVLMREAMQEWDDCLQAQEALAREERQRQSLLWLKNSVCGRIIDALGKRIFKGSW